MPSLSMLVLMIKFVRPLKPAPVSKLQLKGEILE